MAKKRSAASKMLTGAASGAVTGIVYGTIGAVASKGKRIGRGTLVAMGAGAAIGATFALIYHVATG